MKLCKNLMHINFVTFMKRIGQMKGVSKHRNENFTFSAHFSTMGRINLTKGYYSAEYFKSMLFTFISWRSVLLVEETGVTREKHRPAASH
jgi:hypothetical protein